MQVMHHIFKNKKHTHTQKKKGVCKSQMSESIVQ